MARRKKKTTLSNTRKALPLPFDATAWAGIVRSLGLSPQQARIVERILRGMCDKQIALDLGLSVPTVRTYLTRVFHHLEVDDRVQLILRVFAEARPLAGRCHRN